MVDGVSADIASVQMLVDFKLLIQIQLLVDELQQVFKIAWVHSVSDGFVLPPALQAIVSAHGPGIAHP
jgi:hypothetical protein